MFSYCKDGKGIWKELGKTEKSLIFYLGVCFVLL